MYSLSRTAFVRAKLQVFLFTFVLFTKHASQGNMHFVMTFFWLTGSKKRAYFFNVSLNKNVYVYQFFSMMITYRMSKVTASL